MHKKSIKIHNFSFHRLSIRFVYHQSRPASQRRFAFNRNRWREHENRKQWFPNFIHTEIAVAFVYPVTVRVEVENAPNINQAMTTEPGVAKNTVIRCINCDTARWWCARWTTANSNTISKWWLRDGRKSPVRPAANDTAPESLSGGQVIGLLGNQFPRIQSMSNGLIERSNRHGCLSVAPRYDGHTRHDERSERWRCIIK